jgi:hypothetical protein
VGQGYDVWVGNNRGNKYAQGHTNPKISDYDFYNFSFEQMGLFDMPAIYGKILSFYGEGQKIVHIGTSQGSSQMYVGLTDDSTKNFLRKHTKRFIAVAPIAYMTQVTSSGLEYISKFVKLGSFAEDAFGIHGILQGGCFQDPDWIEAMAWACDNLKQFCTGLTDFFIGSNAIDNLESNFDTLINHLPSGASVNAF